MAVPSDEPTVSATTIVSPATTAAATSPIRARNITSPSFDGGTLPSRRDYLTPASPQSKENKPVLGPPEGRECGPGAAFPQVIPTFSGGFPTYTAVMGYALRKAMSFNAFRPRKIPGRNLGSRRWGRIPAGFHREPVDNLATTSLGRVVAVIGLELVRRDPGTRRWSGPSPAPAHGGRFHRPDPAAQSLGYRR